MRKLSRNPRASRSRTPPDLLHKPVPECRKPTELVFVLLRVDCLSIRDVSADDAQGVGLVAHCSRYDALLFIGKSGNTSSDVGERRSGQNSDTVVGLLTRPNTMVASRFDWCERELGALKLGFLKTDCVR